MPNRAHSQAYARPCLDEAAAPALIEALHCLRVAVTVFDPDERLIFANEHYNYLFRSLPPREELVGLTYARLIGLEVAGGEIAEACADDFERFIERRRAQLREGEYRPLDVHLADGRIVEIKARRTRGGIWIALWSDVTQARHAQARLEDAVALSADAFAFFDHDDRVAMCNERYAEFNGYATPGEVIGAPFEALLDRAAARTPFAGTDDPQRWKAKRLAAHRAPAGAMTIEMPSGSAYLMRDRATAEGGRVVVFTDVTDRRRVEIALAEQSSTLARTRSEAAAQADYLAELTRRFDEAAAGADTAKTTLMRAMSHELKTPLNAIIGFSDLMLAMADRLGPEQVKEYASLIHAGGQNLLRLINQILDLTKLAAGRYALRRGTVDVGAVLWRARQAFAARAGERSVALRVEAPTCGLAVEADESAFTSMVFQLVENAVNFTQAGGAVVLSAMRDGTDIRLRVADNGPGVAEEDIARILLPFEQGGRGTCDHTAGAGLGLTLVKALCELHGGTLAIESAPGEGFRATIGLPAKS